MVGTRSVAARAAEAEEEGGPSDDGQTTVEGNTRNMEVPPSG